MLSDFLLFEKMDQRKCIKNCVKNLTKYARIFEMLTTAFGKDKFNCGITGSRKTDKMSMTILILAEQARQQPMENIEGVKEMILNNIRITIKEFAEDDGT